MWLPLYLIEHLGYSKTHGGLFSTMFDIGGILGGPTLGLLVEKFIPDKPIFGIYIGMKSVPPNCHEVLLFSNSSPISLVLMLGTFVLVGFALVASWGTWICALLLLLAGAGNCGPDSLLTGSVTMTIGKLPKKTFQIFKYMI